MVVHGDTDRSNGTPDPPGWRKAYDAVVALGRPASVADVRQEILRNYPRRETSYHNVSADLSKVTANCTARGHHQEAAEPRRTDSGHPLDLLFKRRVNGTRATTFEVYAPRQHGVWEVYRDLSVSTKSKVRIRPLTVGVLGAAIAQAEQEDLDDASEKVLSEEDARRRVSRLIVARRGQSGFRQALLAAYDEACAVTGSRAVDVLEAAHILPYIGKHRNTVCNGLLLRSDIHTLFDLGHLWVDASLVRIAAHLKQTEYGALDGRRLRMPAKLGQCPFPESLDKHARDAKDGLLSPAARAAEQRSKKSE